MAGERFRQLRQVRGISTQDLAQELNVPVGTVEGWERGEIPQSDHLSALAAYFQVSADFLLGLEHRETIDLSGLSQEERQILRQLADYFAGK